MRADILWLLLIPLSLGGWLAYQKVTLGSPVAFMIAQRAWGPTGVVAAARGLIASPFSLGYTALIAVLLLPALYYVRPSYVLFSFISFAVIVYANRPTATRRYTLLLFPLFMVLGLSARAAWVDRLVVLLCTAFAVVVMTQFSLGFFIA